MATKTHDVEELSEGQAWELLDRMARRYLDMSGREFVERWKAGAFGKRPEDDPHVMRVAMLLPLVG